ncbi:NACHT, LRR and PYD domains-containing protein 1b allele 2-like isoform X2 [Trachemys scripta elegans]|uniref:NACHT, LRR and PYD domains-containing protein 1b allele 2-like isoform X2 n=1 Tax=Trachemys scripta elegans TaxID=31138 RepID=UPI001552F861|nr:NACHT, LRR and PYD domains-containing protein 1b allele 2-like isoform X2 [Trachemys scripta elegans]
MRTGACWRPGRELSVDRRDDPTTAGTSCLPPVQHDSMRNQGPVSYASKAHPVFPGEGSQVTGQAHHSLAPTGHSGHMEVLHDQISAEELTSASGFTSEETESHSSSAAGIKAARGETSRSQSPTACLRGQHKCNWCAREEEKDLPEEIKPEIIQDIDGNQEMYRVHFSRAGWFRCPETELEFEVRAAVTIRYGYGSWRQHLTESQQEPWMVAGPLFDIRVEPTETVAAIHLPHFLCLRDADKSWMHIAHFIDEGMILENPTQAVDVYEEKCRSWFVSKSHFTSKPLCFGSRCIVSSPSEITVTPKELPFLDKPADALQPFTEIHTEDVKEELELSLVEKNDEKLIWAAVIRPEDLMPSVSSTKMRTDTHFVDQHREQLIQRVTAVDGILDSLHSLFLDTEQYQRVRAERTNPDKMRKLYELVPSWNSDCKEKLYQVLKDKHRHLVEELSGNR